MDDALFDLAETKSIEENSNRHASTEQISQIRVAFETAGISDQADRKRLVQSVVKRHVPSLRHLFDYEVTGVIYRIKDIISGQKATQHRSAWDDRDEDTWIDKL